MLENRDLQVQTLRMETEAAVAKQTASDAWQVGNCCLTLHSTLCASAAVQQHFPPP